LDLLKVFLVDTYRFIKN